MSSVWEYSAAHHPAQRRFQRDSNLRMAQARYSLRDGRPFPLGIVARAEFTARLPTTFPGTKGRLSARMERAILFQYKFLFIFWGFYPSPPGLYGIQDVEKFPGVATCERSNRRDSNRLPREDSRPDLLHKD
jgi:hypothetical protein